MNKENLPNELFDLLAIKRFEDLNDAEKAMVLQHLSSEAYNELQMVVEQFQAADQEEIVELATPPMISSKQPFSWRMLLHYPIPAYQVAAAVALLLGISFLFRLAPTTDHAPEKGIQVKQNGKPIEKDEYPEALEFRL